MAKAKPVKPVAAADAAPAAPKLRKIKIINAKNKGSARIKSILEGKGYGADDAQCDELYDCVMDGRDGIPPGDDTLWDLINGLFVAAD